MQEVENHVGEELCRLFGEDSDVEWSTVLRRSKEAARRIQQTNGNNSRPRGPMAPLQLQQQHGARRGGGGGFNRERNQQRNSMRGSGGSGGGSGFKFSSGHADDSGRYTALPTTHKRKTLRQLLRTCLSPKVMKCASVSSSSSVFGSLRTLLVLDFYYSVIECFSRYFKFSNREHFCMGFPLRRRWTSHKRERKRGETGGKETFSFKTDALCVRIVTCFRKERLNRPETKTKLSLCTITIL